MIINRAEHVALLVIFQSVFTARRHRFDSLSVTEKHGETIGEKKKKRQ